MILSVPQARSSLLRARPVLAAPLVSVRVERRDLAFARPLATSQGPVTVRPVFLLWVRDADGMLGLGEASPLPWAGTETTEECGAALAGLDAALLRGGDVDGLVADRPAAAAALDLALHDLAACRLAIPLARLLTDGAPTGSVAANALVQTVDDAIAAVAAGYGTLKLKIGRDAGDVARVAAVRDAVGAGIALRLDANGAWPDAASALRGLAPLRSLGIEYVEQPVPPARGPAELAQIRRSAGLAIAADESVTGLVATRELLAAEAADVLVLKPMRLGGLDRALEVAAAARDAGVPVVVTGFLGAAVERAGALHLAAALDGGVPASDRLAHGLGAGAWLAADVARVEVIEGGRLDLPTRAGHGVVLRST